MSTQTTNPQPFKDKLLRELDRQGIGPTDLARRFHPDDTSKEFDSTRRLIHKHLSGKVVPNRSTRRRYERILEMETGSLEPDDEEASRMGFLEGLYAEIGVVLERTKSNATATPLAESAAVASTNGG